MAQYFSMGEKEGEHRAGHKFKDTKKLGLYSIENCCIFHFKQSLFPIKSSLGQRKASGKRVMVKAKTYNIRKNKENAMHIPCHII